MSSQKGFIGLFALVAIIVGVIVVGVIGVYFAVRQNTASRMSQNTDFFTSTTSGVTRPPANPTSNTTVTLISLTPTSGPIGTVVTIVGSGFVPLDNTVHFDVGGSLHVSSLNNGTLIHYTIPSSVGPCALVDSSSLNRCGAPAKLVPPGTYQLSVSNAAGSSNTMTFSVTGR